MRIVLKLSGELLKGSLPFGICQEACHRLALSLKELRQTGLEIALVLGGGNIFRGMPAKELGMARTTADQIGMLATMMNGLALEHAMNAVECPTVALTALDCPKAIESYTWRKASEALRTGHVLLFVGGTGNPYFTTDTAASLRASEIEADALWKATKVNGVYNKDPLKYPEAKQYQEISYAQVLAEKLEVMDATSIALCRSNQIPVYVFNMSLLSPGKSGSILQSGGTWIKDA